MSKAQKLAQNRGSDTTLEGRIGVVEGTYVVGIDRNIDKVLRVSWLVVAHRARSGHHQRTQDRGSRDSHDPNQAPQVVPTVTL